MYFGGLLVTVTSWSVAAFLTYQMVYLAHPKGRWWGNFIPDLPWSMITSVFMIIVAGRAMLKTPLPRIRDTPPWKWVLAILILNVAISPIAVSNADHQKILTEFLKLGIIVVCAHRLLSDYKRLLASIWVYLAGVAYIGVIAHTVGRRGGRVEGIGPIDSPDSNGTASIFVPAVPILLVLFCTGSVRAKIFAALFGAYIVNGLVLLNSRGAFLGVLASTAIVLYFLLRSPMQAGRQRLSAILSVLLGIAGALYLADDIFWDRMNTLRTIEEDPEGGATRVNYWMTTFKVVAERPFGGGARAFQNLSAQYLDPEYLGKSSGKAVHSTWFQTFVETGWLGIFLFIGMCVTALNCARRAMKRTLKRNDAKGYWISLSISAGFIGYLVTSSFIDRYRAEILYWFVMYCMVIYSIYVYDSENTQTVFSNS